MRKKVSIEIKPYTEDLIDAVKDFNLRIREGGFHWRFPESHISEGLPKIGNRKIYQEYFLALENDSIVRGGYILKHQEFSFKGKIISVGDYQLPLSEVLINKKYSRVGKQLLTNALKKQPLLYTLGMGGFENRLPRALKSAGWSLCAVPFFFKVNHPFRFFKNITYLRKTKLKSLFLDFLAITGLGWIAVKLLQILRQKRKMKGGSVSLEVVDDFSGWADELWDECKDKFSMIAVRDSTTLNILYPSTSKRFTRMKVLQGHKLVGWIVVLNTQMSNHKQFGNMRVGSIADCLALPENAFKVVAAATEYLEKSGADIIVSNQSHASWCSALKNAGFISGPSNFVFAASPGLAQLLHPFELKKSSIHINRGDGSGPLHL
jgi:hypothetical protein